MQAIHDPDWRQAVDAKHSFATGVPLGVGIKVPWIPAVFERKRSWMSLDEMVCDLDKGNDKSASAVLDQLELQFIEDEKCGMMFREREDFLRCEYPGDKFRIAALGAMQKGDTTFRVVHDGTHGVRLNNDVKPRDQIRMPGPAEARVIISRASQASSCSFS